jgi:hypothetical protein
MPVSFENDDNFPPSVVLTIKLAFSKHLPKGVEECVQDLQAGPTGGQLPVLVQQHGQSGAI